MAILDPSTNLTLFWPNDRSRLNSFSAIITFKILVNANHHIRQDSWQQVSSDPFLCKMRYFSTWMRQDVTKIHGSKSCQSICQTRPWTLNKTSNSQSHFSWGLDCHLFLDIFFIVHIKLKRGTNIHGGGGEVTIFLANIGVKTRLHAEN